MQLSKNFTLEELTHSNSAIAKKLNNTPTPDVIENLRLLCEHVLQPIRDHFGAITINCGYRSPAVNKAVGGVSNSQHILGMAADIDTPSKNKEIFEWIKTNLEFDQIIDENDYRWVHCSFSKINNRKEVLHMNNSKHIKL